MRYNIYLGCFEDFLHAYAGLSVDGSMMRSLLIEGSNENKQWKRLARRKDASLVLDLICVEERSFGLTPMRFQTDPIFGFGSNYEKGQTGILRVLCTRKRNLVLGANAQRISRPSYTAVVRTNGYLRSVIQLWVDATLGYWCVDCHIRRREGIVVCGGKHEWAL